MLYEMNVRGLTFPRLCVLIDILLKGAIFLTNILLKHIASHIDKVSQEFKSALQTCFVFIYFEKSGYQMLAGKEKNAHNNILERKQRERAMHSQNINCLYNEEGY